ncbi:MAG: M23 family metallopeptidase [Clostridia bacterium]|nr:M23 family metallopeptidase [Clostridia bacterium]
MAKSNGLRFHKRGFPLAVLLLVGAFAAGSATFLALHDAMAPGAEEELRLSLPAPADSGISASDSPSLRSEEETDAPPSSPERYEASSEGTPRITAIDPSSPPAPPALQADPVPTRQEEADFADDLSVSAAALGDRTVSLLFIRPIDGSILKPWSADELVYSKTLADYRIHNGVDLAASPGTPVHAMADGILTDIYDDDLLGRIVEITHEGGTVTRYCNLQPTGLAGIRIGGSVKMGDVIAQVGESALCECGEPPHLHLETLRNGQFIDPESLFR